MNMGDIVIICGLVIAWGFSKEPASAWLAIAFICTVIFANSSLYDILPSVYIHMSYAAIIAAFIPLAAPNIWVAIGMGAYGIFNLIIALDYFFYPKIDTIVSIYYVQLHIIIDICLIYLSTKKVDNNGGNSDTTIAHIVNWLGYMSRSIKCLQRV